MDLKITIAELGQGGYSWVKTTITLKNVNPDVTIRDVDLMVRQILSKLGDLE